MKAGSEHDFDAAFQAVVQSQASVLVVAPDALFSDRRNQIVALAARYSVPTIYELREFVVAGGLLSYGISSSDIGGKPELSLAEFSRVRNPPICQ